MTVNTHCTALGCDKPLSKLGSFVKVGDGMQHLDCFLEPLITKAHQDGYKARVAEEQQAFQRALDVETAAQRTKSEEALAARLAAQAVEAEKARINAMTKTATEKLRSLTQGQEVPRFQQVAEEIDTEFIEAEATRRAKEAAETKARQDAESAQVPKCVRCGSPDVNSYHPRHCSKCWMDNQTGQEAGLTKQDLNKLDLSILNRPIELE